MHIVNKPAAPKGGAGQRVGNKVLVVEDFVEKDGQVGVKGKDILTGEECLGFLSTEGREAENPGRKSLAELRKGFSTGQKRYQLVPGGVLCLDRAAKKGDAYIGFWPTVLAYSPQDAAERFVHGMCILGIWKKEGGKEFGVLSVYADNPSDHIQGQGDDVAAAVAAFAGKANKPGMLLRWLDDAGKVVGFDTYYGDYDAASGGDKTPDAFAADVVAEIEKGKKALAEAGVECAGVSLVPMQRFPVSQFTLHGAPGDRRPGKLERFRKLADLYSGEDSETGKFKIRAIPTFAKLDEEGVFVNDVTIGDLDLGVDPVLLGGLSYAGAGQTAGEETSAGSAPAPEVGTLSSEDPFRQAGSVFPEAEEGAGPGM